MNNNIYQITIEVDVTDPEALLEAVGLDSIEDCLKYIATPVSTWPGLLIEQTDAEIYMSF